MPDYDYDELFPGRFIKAGLLKGKSVTVTIADVVLEELPDKKGKRNRGVVSFVGKKMELVLNKTNGECLKGMFGRRTGAWIGKRITLFPTMVDAFGRKKLAIRILGSPDIPKDMSIHLSLGQEVARVTMKKTQLNNQAAPSSPAELEGETGDEASDELAHDPITGELPLEEPGMEG